MSGESDVLRAVWNASLTVNVTFVVLEEVGVDELVQVSNLGVHDGSKDLVERRGGDGVLRRNREFAA